jgi:hypothetical protein
MNDDYYVMILYYEPNAKEYDGFGHRLTYWRKTFNVKASSKDEAIKKATDLYNSVKANKNRQIEKIIATNLSSYKNKPLQKYPPNRKFDDGGGVGMNDDYVVSVGNIGNISADNLLEARMMYNEYVEQSKSGVGRAGNEYVGLLKNGEPILEHFGTMNDDYFFDEDDYENN